MHGFGWHHSTKVLAGTAAATIGGTSGTITAGTTTDWTTTPNTNSTYTTTHATPARGEGKPGFRAEAGGFYAGGQHLGLGRVRVHPGIPAEWHNRLVFCREAAASTGNWSLGYKNTTGTLLQSINKWIDPRTDDRIELSDEQVDRGLEPKEFEQEFADDIISLVASYSGRMYGRRGGRKKKVKADE